MKRLITGLLMGCSLLVLFSCKDNSLEALRKDELAKLDAFIKENYPGEEPKPSGLYYIEEIKGSGDSIVPGDKVQIFYAAWTVDSILVDETNGYTNGYRFEPLEFTVLPASQLSASTATSISKTPGLHEAITYMQLGTVSNLVMPSQIAYGQNGMIGIPGFTTLLLHVEVYKVYRANSTSSQ